MKKTMKNKREITEYICKVDQDELGIMEDEFDDLKDLFKVVTIFVLTLTLRSSLQMFDVDQDGILNLMEAQHVLGCLGFRGTSAESVNIRNNVYRSKVKVIPIHPQIARLVEEVSVDKTQHSLSFNEYLILVSVNRRAQPTQNALLDAFM